MVVQLSHPHREVEIKGPKRVREMLRDLNLVVEAHLVIRGDELMTEDEVIADADHIEIRPVISGGSPVKRETYLVKRSMMPGNYRRFPFVVHDQCFMIMLQDWQQNELYEVFHQHESSDRPAAA